MMKQRTNILIVLVTTVLLSVLPAAPALAAPPAQDPRPPTDTGGGAPPPPAPGNGNGSSGSGACAALNGQVLNWGVGGMGGVGVQLRTGSWEVDTASASDGNYGFGGMGVGFARLHVTVPPEQVGLLEPLIQDAGVYLNCDFPVTANLALYSGPRAIPPATLNMSAPDGLTPGKNTVIRLVIENNLPTPISNVTVTDVMPPGLTATDVATADNSGDVKFIDGAGEGQMVWVRFDSIPSGGEENILIIAAVDGDLPTGTKLRNTATLFYNESVAHQAWLDFTAGVGAVSLPESAAPSATPTEEAEAAPTEEPTPTPEPEATAAADEGENFVPPGGLPKTGDDFMPPPGLLPETGQNDMQIPVYLPETGVSPFVPLSGLVLGGIALAFRAIRAVYRRRR